MMTFLQSRWAASSLGALLYCATTVATLFPRLAQHAPARGKTPGGPSAAATAPAPQWNQRDIEVEQLVAELKKEKEAISEKEKQLAEWAARLQSERLEINQVTQSVYHLEEEFDRNVTRVKQEELANLKRLAKVYAEMGPETAAVVFKQMEDPAVVKILVFMKDAETAPILENMAKKGETDAKRVAQLTERLRVAIRTTAPAAPK
jgi:flagellar motility protein MotE (MotC chaperone)